MKAHTFLQCCLKSSVVEFKNLLFKYYYVLNRQFQPGASIFFFFFFFFFHVVAISLLIFARN